MLLEKKNICRKRMCTQLILGEAKDKHKTRQEKKVQFFAVEFHLIMKPLRCGYCGIVLFPRCFGDVCAEGDEDWFFHDISHVITLK